MTKTTTAHASERGAVLVHVALALLALMAFSTFVIDYGVLWTARRQAQNAADAAALAGAVALAFDNPSDFSNSGPAKTSAYQVVMSHPVWGQQPVVNITTDITFPACPDDASSNCIRVDVYRDASHGNPLPTIFGQLVGLGQQGVRAMAIAKVAVANSTDCLKPWAVVDKWEERWPLPPVAWTPNSVYDKYIKVGGNIIVDPSIIEPDRYIAPTTSSTGTGFFPFNPDKSYSVDYGRQLMLKVGDQNDFQFVGGWFGALSLGGAGGKTYKENIKGCVGITYKIGDDLQFSTEPGEKVGPSKQAVADEPQGDADSLFNQDPTAYWDAAMNGGRGGVAGSAFSVSPRIVAVPLINPEAVVYANQNGRTTVPISNIMGFFVEGWDDANKAIVGRLVTTAGLLQVGGGGTVGPQSGFLQAIILVR
ncbi:MAG TPA: pilus assembly protein TadG-related protein [Vicinamibacterales bacterium]|nr:pilus assembly protein TadG-related protein [Vicinamibacterales bacterium]